LEVLTEFRTLFKSIAVTPSANKSKSSGVWLCSMLILQMAYRNMLLCMISCCLLDSNSLDGALNTEIRL